MSLRSKLRVLVVCVALQVGAASGIPMLPDDICELMNQLNQPTLAHILPAADDGRAGPPADDARDPSRGGDRR